MLTQVKYPNRGKGTVVEIDPTIESTWYNRYANDHRYDGITYEAWLGTHTIPYDCQFRWDEYQGQHYLTLYFESAVDAVEFKLKCL